MMTVKCVALVVLIVFVVSGCTIPHHPAQDYEQYLINNDEKSSLSTTELETSYVITQETVEHRYEFRSATVGYANLWVVEFGKMLETTLQSEDVQEAFHRLIRKTADGELAENLTTFHLVDYKFFDYGAHIILEISVSKNDEEIFRQTYDEDGKTQGGKMFWGGAFAMKNAIQQSTKLAIDKIITDFISDINATGATEIIDSSESYSSPTNPDAFDKAKKCQDKGGVWINNICQIQID